MLGGTINGGGAFFVKDIYQNLFRPNASNRELISASYVSSLVLVAAGFVMGVYAANINDLWGWLMMSLTVGGIAPSVLRLYWWRLNAWGVMGGMAMGTIGSIAQRFFLPHMLEWQQFIVMTLLSVVGTIALTLLTEPTPMDTLTNFYKTTRPFGFWGPVVETFSKADRKELAKEHKNDIIAVPFALLWQVTLFLLPMQLVIKAYDSFWKTLPLFLVGLAGMYFYWWRNLPPESEERIDEHGTPAVREPVLPAEKSRTLAPAE